MTLPMPFKTLRITRWHMLREIDGLTRDQLLEIPEGRPDNILWNIGHLLCSLSRLTYVFSGHPLPIPEAYLGLFGKDTNALDWESTPDVDEVLGEFNALLDDIERDYGAGHFESYKSVPMGPSSIESVEEAIAFHSFHEGLHIGKILDIKELLGLPTKGG